MTHYVQFNILHRDQLPSSGWTHSSKYRFFNERLCIDSGSTSTVRELMIWSVSAALKTVVKLEYDVLLVDRIWNRDAKSPLSTNIYTYLYIQSQISEKKPSWETTVNSKYCSIELQ